MGIQTTTTLKHTTSTTNQHNNFQSLIMESIKQGANYVAETVQGAVSGASNMQNSRKQYLQLHGIPLNARLWSLMVNSKPAKPVRGKDGDLLIPLLVGIGGSSNEGAHTSSVEITYLVQRDPLGTSGTLDLAPPRLDVAISRLQMEVQWP